MSAPRILNRKLVLETAVRTDDGAGGFVETWSEVGRLWARIEARSGVAAGAEALPVAAVSYRITVRAAPPGSPQRPRPGQVLREGVRRFVVQAVAEADGAGRLLTCFAREEEIPA